MIDELLDSLLLDRIPTQAQLEADLNELTRSAEDLHPILHSFKRAGQLRVGVRDVLGKESVKNINAALSDIAEACIRRIASAEYEKLKSKFGEPMTGSGDSIGQPAELVIVALGKFGGRELNYHSDLDLVFLYDADGSTFHARRTRNSGETKTNQHFFSELAQRIVKAAGHLGPYGRLYEIDPRLRPTGRSGRLATSLDEFARYFAEGEGQLWERQALTRARVIYGSDRAADRTLATITQATFDTPWRPEFADAIRRMRLRLEETASQANLKRGPGGIVDIEFIVQMLLLKHGREHPSIRQPNTIDALAALFGAGLIDRDDFGFFSTSYEVLRSIQGRLRLMNMTALNDLPSDTLELNKLAHLLGYPGREKLLADCQRLQTENRRRFDAIVEGELAQAVIAS
jgi:glutamate-ammonia-ligase adenylyltransferase